MSKKNKAERRKGKLRAAHSEIHLIDIENVLGRSRFAARDVERFRPFYLKANSVPANSVVVIGVSSSDAYLAASYGWPGARVVYLAGKDGADRALIAVSLEEHVEDRFEKAVIASGDHEFVEAVISLQGWGMNVTVFARATCLSAELWSSCKNVIVFSAKDFALAA